jgi:thiol:disulfide interchange protein DsbD
MQAQDRMTWDAWKLSNSAPKNGEIVEIIFTASIQPGWYFYANDFDKSLGPMLTTFSFEESESFEVVGEATPVGSKKKYDDVWEGEISYFTTKVEFRQKIKVVDAANLSIRASVRGQLCSDETGKCILVKKEF